MNLKIIEESLLPFVEQMGYELNEVGFRKENGMSVLVVVLDRVEPIDMASISLASEKISEFLDKSNLIEEKYILDVSSLGIEKPIKVERLHQYIGHCVNLHLNNPIKGENIIEGVVEKVDGDHLEITYKVKTKTMTLNIDLKNISKARLAVKF